MGRAGHGWRGVAWELGWWGRALQSVGGMGRHAKIEPKKIQANLCIHTGVGLEMDWMAERVNFDRIWIGLSGSHLARECELG